MAVLAAVRAAAEQPLEPAAAGTRRCVTLEAFIRSDRPTSQKARAALEKLANENPGIQLQVRDVIDDPRALARFYDLARQFRIERPIVPATLVMGQFHVGWPDDKTALLRIRGLLTIELFTREGCPRCAAVKAFFASVGPNYPGCRVEIHDLINDVEARARFEQLCQTHRVQAPSLPGIHIGGQLLIGYQGDGITGRKIESLLNSVTVPCNPKRGALKAGEPRQSLLGGSTLLRAGIGLICSLYVEPGQSTDGQSTDGVSQVPPEDDVPGGDAPPPISNVPPEASSAAGVPSGIPTSETGATHSEQADSIELPLLGRLRVRDLGLPAFTFVVGLIDGFNPCAMWVLLFLLSVLVNLQDRRKIVAVAGTFVLVSGLAYFAFMAAWLNVFLLIGLARPAQIALALLAIGVGSVHVKDFFAFKKGISLSIPDSAKPGIYERIRKIVMAEHLAAAIAGAIVLAVLVNVVELLCTAGLPALYTQILTMQQLPTWQNYAYLALYNVAYMFDDTVMLCIVVATLSRGRLQERGGRWLKLVSGLAILLLGLVMLFKPEWLT